MNGASDARERPELQRPAPVHIRGEVVDRLVDEEPVRDIQERGAEPVERIERLQRSRHDCVREGSREEHDARRGRIRRTSPRVEPAEVDVGQRDQIAEQYRVTRKPDNTKKTSTPMNPCRNQPGPAWYARTR